MDFSTQSGNTTRNGELFMNFDLKDIKDLVEIVGCLADTIEATTPVGSPDNRSRKGLIVADTIKDCRNRSSMQVDTLRDTYCIAIDI